MGVSCSFAEMGMVDVFLLLSVFFLFFPCGFLTNYLLIKT